MTAIKGERIDKFLWHVRIYKSRSIATEECRKGRVMTGGVTVKPAHPVSEGAVITVRKPPVTYTYSVTAIPKGRVGAPLVSSFIADLTPQEEKDKLVAGKMANGIRPRGSGRPTKRERRELEDFLE
ncbi:MAG: S4 domain-containing protein [Bacteroidales bacterium]|jgi:ribosome-associated heat shock protein Hsp15|nr:S4 domain-containing protein [Bacteroidales bacterium]